MITSEEYTELTGKGQVEVSRMVEIFCLGLHSLQLMGQCKEDLSISLYVNYPSIEKSTREKHLFLSFILIINVC